MVIAMASEKLTELLIERIVLRGAPSHVLLPLFFCQTVHIDYGSLKVAI